MATWIAHLRVAENILGDLKDVQKEVFVAGNIAPDAGVPNEDWSKFDPPTAVTHWKDSEGKIDADAFFHKYVQPSRATEDVEFHSFVLGYYVHLLADIEWGKMIDFKMEAPLCKENLAKDQEFIWRIKDDWYGQDFVYLNENRDSLFFTCFQHIHEVKDYLDYFPTGAFTNRFKYIREVYLDNYMKCKPESDFIFLSKVDMDRYVDNATLRIKRILFRQGF